jgi:predicted cobalt transporter CbtA
VPSVRSFLVRGLLAGLVAGLAAFAVAYVVGEPSLGAAIGLEDAASAAGAHSHAAGEGHAAGEAHAAGEGHAAGAGHAAGTVVPRALQSTLGLATGTLVAGVTLGGLLGVLSALVLGRLGSAGPRSTALLLAGVGLVAAQLVPFWAYPPNPPGVGTEATLGLRTSLYFLLLAISVLAAVAAVLTGRALHRRWGAWYAGLAAVAAYLLLVCATMALLPGFDEVPASYPATLLFDFRMASLLTSVTLWAVLGVTLAELLARLVRRPGVGSPAPAPLVRSGA